MVGFFLLLLVGSFRPFRLVETGGCVGFCWPLSGRDFVCWGIVVSRGYVHFSVVNVEEGEEGGTLWCCWEGGLNLLVGDDIFVGDICRLGETGSLGGGNLALGFSVRTTFSERWSGSSSGLLLGGMVTEGGGGCLGKGGLRDTGPGDSDEEAVIF